jgi:hypothetical protein
MAYHHYDRLTALDASFLELESASVHMHVGSVGIFDPGPLMAPDGQDRLRTRFERWWIRVLKAVGPRFRQRIERTPVDRVHPGAGVERRAHF